MSQNSASTQYMFTITTGNGSISNQGQWSAVSACGMTDEFANQIVQAIKGITPPAGATIAITVQKEDDTSTLYTTNYSTDPISFT